MVVVPDPNSNEGMPIVEDADMKRIIAEARETGSLETETDKPSENFSLEDIKAAWKMGQLECLLRTMRLCERENQGMSINARFVPQLADLLSDHLGKNPIRNKIMTKDPMPYWVGEWSDVPPGEFKAKSWAALMDPETYEPAIKV